MVPPVENHYAAKFSAAALAVGLSLAGPHAAIAAADSGSDSTSTSDVKTAAAAHSRTAAGGVAKSPARAAAGDPAPAKTAAGNRSSNRAALATAGRQSSTLTGHLPAQASLPTAALLQPTPRVAPRRAVAVAASGPEAPEAAAAPDLATIATVHVTQVFDLIGHWLADLPHTPGTDFLTGALLLARRDLAAEVPAVTARQALATAVEGTSPKLTSITSTPGGNSVVLTFDTPLVRDSATDLANYRITAPTLFFNKPEVVTRSGPAVKILRAEYTDISETASQVTLTLARPLWQGVFYRIFINGELPVTNYDPNSNPVAGVGFGRTTFDGDNDQTPGGNFWGLFAVGKRLTFTDASGDRVALTATDGAINVWRTLNGDIDQITVVPGTTALSGSVIPGRDSTGTVYIGGVAIPVPTPLNLNGAANNLPQSFSVVPSGGLTQPPPLPTQVSPQPIVATSQNLPYTLAVTPVTVPGADNLPAIQSAVYAHTAPTAEHPSGLWVFFGGRTTGRHGFFIDPAKNFPTPYQNPSIYVVDPISYEVWSMPWNQTDVPASTSNSLSSTNQEYYQKGDTLYVVSGYSKPYTVQFTGDVSAGSDTISVVSGLDRLAVGLTVAGVTPLTAADLYPPDTTITAISGSTVTTSRPSAADGTGVALAASKGDFTTYDTLTALSISGMAEAVMNGDAADLATLANIRQITDPRLGVSGGVLTELNGRFILTGGHNFQGALAGAPGVLAATIAQVYTDEIKSWRIFDTGRSLMIFDYQAQHDSVNFRRRDGNLVPLIGPGGRQQLAFLGGVFTTDTGGYQAPILIGSNGNARVDAAYQQFFSQYSAAHFSLYDRSSGNNFAVLMGGLSLYSYSDGELSPPDFDLPWVADVTSLVQSRDGSFQEYIMAPIPAVTSGDTGFYGAYAGFFQNPALPTYSNGVIQLDRLTGPTVVGYMYGGIHSIAGFPPPGGTSASSVVFQIILTPTGGRTA